mmetsp:Transcript_23010/g.64233  ORF Transcript_23010/g.64233 Transcript_23010/m.64233 type:complete len:210 (-) Transcript_23010:686-1315(-)
MRELQPVAGPHDPGADRGDVHGERRQRAGRQGRVLLDGVPARVPRVLLPQRVILQTHKRDREPDRRQGADHDQHGEAQHCDAKPGPDLRDLRGGDDQHQQHALAHELGVHGRQDARHPRLALVPGQRDQGVQPRALACPRPGPAGPGVPARPAGDVQGARAGEPHRPARLLLGPRAILVHRRGVEAVHRDWHANIAPNLQQHHAGGSQP